MEGFGIFLRHLECPVSESKAVPLTPLYRGMAGEYKSGRNDIQHFAGDIPTAVRYAKMEAAKPENVAKGLKPTVYRIMVPSALMEKYRTVGNPQDEIYDIPAHVVDRYPREVIPFEQAERMATSHHDVIDLINNPRTPVPVIFKGQGPIDDGWAVRVHPMGKPQEVEIVVLRGIRDVEPAAIRHRALLTRMEHLGERGTLLIAKDGRLFVTAMPQMAQRVAIQQAGVPT